MGSTIDRSQPANHAALTSSAVRANFGAAANDVERLEGLLNGVFLQITKSAATSYTVAATDSGQLLRFTSSSPVAITMPTFGTDANVLVGYSGGIEMAGTGQLTISKSGSDIIQCANGLSDNVQAFSQHSILIWILVDIDGSNNRTWLIKGEVA